MISKRVTVKVLKFAGQNLALQIIGIATGLIIIRALNLTSYAHYSIFITLLFSSAAISDSGIGTTLLARGAEVRAKPHSLGELFGQGIRFRTKIGRWLSAGSSALLVLLLSLTGAGPLEVAAMALLLIVTLSAFYRRGIWQCYYRLEYRAAEAQLISVVGGAIRLSLVIPALFMHELAIYWIAAATAATYLLEAYLLKYRSKLDLPPIEHGQPTDGRFATAFRTVIPMTIASELRGFTFMFVVGILGSPEALAQVSALSRFTVAFAVLDSIVLELVSPKLARAQGSRRRTLKVMSLALMIYSMIALAAIVATYFLSDILLSVMGPQYDGLRTELMTVFAGVAACNAAVAWGALNQAKLWIHGSWVLVPLIILWGGSAYLFDVSSSRGAAIFYAAQAVPLLATECYRTFVGYRRAKRSLNSVARGDSSQHQMDASE